MKLLDLAWRLESESLFSYLSSRYRKHSNKKEILDHVSFRVSIGVVLDDLFAAAQGVEISAAALVGDAEPSRQSFSLTISRDSRPIIGQHYQDSFPPPFFLLKKKKWYFRLR